MSEDDLIAEWIEADKRRVAQERRDFFKALTPHFRVDGFKRGGQVFRKQVGIDTQILDFEPWHGAFRLHIGVYFPDLVTIASDGIDSPHPLNLRRAWRCWLSEYLADIDPEVNEGNAYDLSRIVEWVSVIRRSAIPWLDRASKPTFDGLKSPELEDWFKRMWDGRQSRAVNPPTSGPTGSAI